jgi:regulator of chromosome condensation
LGRVTNDVDDPSNPGSKIPNEDLETYPYVVEALEKQGFRAVQVAAGDSVSVAISDKGELRAWGSFRVGECSFQKSTFELIVAVERWTTWIRWSTRT